MYEEITHVFDQIGKISKEEKLILREIFTPKKLKKNEFFLLEGQQNNKAAFIRKGLLRYYVIKNDEESTLEFSQELEFVADFPSFAQRGVSMQNIQAVEDCELLVSNYDGIQRIYNEFEDGNLIGRKIMEHRFIIMMNQLLSIYMHKPEQRYLHFIEHYKDVAQRIPQYLIASYVGIQAPSLSRIRNRLAKQDRS